MPTNRLKEFLDTNNVKYITISHSRAFTAQETATSAHIARKELAKRVMVKFNGKIVKRSSIVLIRYPFTDFIDK